MGAETFVITDTKMAKGGVVVQETEEITVLITEKVMVALSRKQNKSHRDVLRALHCTPCMIYPVYTAIIGGIHGGGDGERKPEKWVGI
jgi:hypothetical protein